MNCKYEENKKLPAKEGSNKALLDAGIIDENNLILDREAFEKENKSWSAVANKSLGTEEEMLYSIDDLSKIRDISKNADGSTYRGASFIKYKSVANEKMFDRLDRLKNSIDRNQKQITLVNPDTLVNFTENLKEIFKNNVEEVKISTNTSELTYIDAIKTKDGRYFIISEGQDLHTIDKQEYEKVSYENEMQTISKEESDIFERTFLQFDESDQIANYENARILNKFFTKDEYNLALLSTFNRGFKKKEQLSKEDSEVKANSSVIEKLFEKFYSAKDKATSASDEYIDLHNKSRSAEEDSFETTQRKIELMQKALDAVVLIDRNIEGGGILLSANHALTKKHKKPVILINPDKMFSDTVIHEFGHLYIELLSSDDALLNQAYELLRGTDLYIQIQEQYPELQTQEDIDKEVLATALGLEGDKIFKKDLEDLNIWQKIKNYILNKLRLLFKIEPNAIEKLATEMLRNKLRLTGAENYNNTIDRYSKFLVDKHESNKQKSVVDLFERINKSFTKETIDGENIYKDSEGKIHNHSVTRDIQKYKKIYSTKSADKGTRSISFNRELISKDNLLIQLQSPEISAALAGALNNLLDGKIGNEKYAKHSEDLTWFHAYQRDIVEHLVGKKKEDELDELFAELIEENGDNSAKSFISNMFDNYDAIIDEAERIQESYNIAPKVGNMIHDAIEEYILNGTPFPRNIDDEAGLLDEIKKIITNGKARGSVFVTEQILFSENKGRPGTADLIEILPNGECVIYDYKTTSSFNIKNKDNVKKSDYSLYFSSGYAHQLASYGNILSQYGITLHNDPYHIVMASLNYSGFVDENSEITVKEVRVKSLKDKNVSPIMNKVNSQVFKDYAKATKLTEINLQDDIRNLDQLVKKIEDHIINYKERTKNLSTLIDDSYLSKVQTEIAKSLKENVDEYISKSNSMIVTSYIENIHKALSVLEVQKVNIGEEVSAEYVQNLDYLIKSTGSLEDISRILREDTETEFDNKDLLISLTKEAIDLVSTNKTYYKEKLKLLAIGNLAENSNFMEGLYFERYKLEAREMKGLKSRKDIEEYAIEQIRIHKDEINVREVDYWTKQYQDGITDLRFMEYLLADPGMSKSQFVQVVKNIMDKADYSKRSRMMEIMPEINNWYKSLKFETKGDPKKVWNKFIEKRDKELTSMIIPEFISKYRIEYMKYEYQIHDMYKELRSLYRKSNTEENLIKIHELKKKISDLQKEKAKELAKMEKKDPNFKELYENPEFTKLSNEEKEAVKFIHKNLIDADERIEADYSKKLTRTLSDGSIIYNLPRQRMSSIEASYSTGGSINRMVSGITDMLRPPADSEENFQEFQTENKFNSNTLDAYGNEVFETPLLYRTYLEDESLQSYDIPSLLALNHETTINHQESKLIEADLYIIKESLNSSNNEKILKSDSMLSKAIKDKTVGIFQKSDQNLVYQAVKASIDNRLYKRTYGGTYSKGNYMFIQAAEVVNQYASILSLSGNFMSSLATFSQGSIFRSIEGIVGEHFTTNDWKNGTKKAWSDVGGMIKDTQKFVPESKTNLLMKKLGLDNQGHALTNKFVQDNLIKKNLDKGTLFAITSIAESLVTANLMYSLLNNIKCLDGNGNYINKEGKKTTYELAMSLDEAYELKDGKLELNENVKYTTFNVTNKYSEGASLDNTNAATEISAYIQSVYGDLYGMYNQDLKSTFQRTIVGKMTMSLRGWLPRGVHKRWRGITTIFGEDALDFETIRNEENLDKRFYSQSQKRFQEGNYTTSLRFMKSLYTQMKKNQLTLAAARKKVRSLMTDHELANLKRTQYELAVMTLTFAISMFLRALAMTSNGDDKDKEKLYFVAYLASRINTELATFISPNAAMEMIQNPAASLSTIERIFDFVQQLAWFSFDDTGSMDFNINDEYEKGNKKGDLKVLNKSMNLIPGRVKFEQLKSIFGLESNSSIEDSFMFSIRNR